MNRYYFFLVLLLSIMIPSSVLAAPVTDVWNRTCIGGVETALFCDGLCSNPGAVIINHTRVCTNGCNNQTYTCDEAYNVPTELFSLTVLGFLGIAALFIVIGKVFPDDWKIMPILFYIMAVIFIVMDVGILGSFFVVGQNGLYMIVNSAYLGAGFTMFIFIAYIVMRYVVGFAVNTLRGVKRRGR